MADIVTHANAALRAVGGTRIASLSDGSKNANAVLDVYEQVRDDLLAAHDWKFATRRVKLARSSTAPTSGFDYAYALPSDWVRTSGVFDNDAETGNIDYREGEIAAQGCILTDAEDVYLVYVYKCTDVARWSADFVRAFIKALAGELAIPVANSNTLEETRSAQATKHLNRAKSKDAMGSNPPTRPRGSWVNSRASWGK